MKKNTPYTPPPIQEELQRWLDGKNCSTCSQLVQEFWNTPRKGRMTEAERLRYPRIVNTHLNYKKEDPNYILEEGEWCIEQAPVIPLGKVFENVFGSRNRSGKYTSKEAVCKEDSQVWQFSADEYHPSESYLTARNNESVVTAFDPNSAPGKETKITVLRKNYRLIENVIYHLLKDKGIHSEKELRAHTEKKLVDHIENELERCIDIVFYNMKKRSQILLVEKKGYMIYEHPKTTVHYFGNNPYNISDLSRWRYWLVQTNVRAAMEQVGRFISRAELIALLQSELSKRLDIPFEPFMDMFLWNDIERSNKPEFKTKTIGGVLKYKKA